MTDGYPYWQSIPTRWKDNDIYGHLNNVVHYSIMDTTINTWLIEQGGLDIAEGTVIGLCVESQCKYLDSASFPDLLTVGLRVGYLGRSSVRYEIGIYRHDGKNCIAEGNFVRVFVDRTTRRPVEINGKLRASLAELQLG